MKSMKRLGIAFVMAFVLAGFVSAFGVAPAAAATVKCQVTMKGKTGVKQVANAEECTKMGGKVVAAKKSHKKSAPPAAPKSAPPAPSGSGTAPPQ